MSLTALQSQGEGLGAASLLEYRGATTAARYGDPQAEWSAMRQGCGVYDLGYRAKISLTGSDRVRWLNGMVTNNIRDLQLGHGVYAFLLNPQGHILGDLYAYNRGESIMVDTDRSQIEKVLATFDHYIIMDDVEVRNLSVELTAIGIAGPESREVLARSGMRIPELEPLQIFEGPCTVVRGDDLTNETYELWLPAGEVKKMWEAIVQHGATPIGFEALELERIVAGMPLHGVDIRERDLPQETEQTRALNFNKGCYVGQEIVERIRSRGAVHRKFSGFVIDNGATIAAGEKVLAGEKEVGEITSTGVFRLGQQNKTIALGYIRREVGTPGREVTIGAFRATVIALPVDNGTLAGRSNALEKHSA